MALWHHEDYNMNMKFIARSLVLCLGILFVWAGITKIDASGHFMIGVLHYDILNTTGVIITATVLPWLEVIVGLCLVGNVNTKGALAIAIVMLTAFEVAQILAVLRGISIACNCFGGSPHSANDQTIGAFSITRTLCLLVIALFLYSQIHRQEIIKHSRTVDNMA